MSSVLTKKQAAAHREETVRNQEPGSGKKQATFRRLPDGTPHWLPVLLQEKTGKIRIARLLATDTQAPLQWSPYHCDQLETEETPISEEGEIKQVPAYVAGIIDPGDKDTWPAKMAKAGTDNPYEAARSVGLFTVVQKWSVQDNGFTTPTRMLLIDTDEARCAKIEKEERIASLKKQDAQFKFAEPTF